MLPEGPRPMLKCAPVPAVVERLHAAVLRHCPDARVLACEFVPGGKLHGVGIPSPLYCRTCGHAQLWHDVAIALAAIIQREDVA